MAVTLPRPTNHAPGDPNFVPDINQIEEAINQILVGTGWRNIGAANLVTGVTGNIAIARSGNRVTLRFHNLASGTSGNQNILVAALPVGFRPDQDRQFRVWGNAGTTQALTVLSDGRIQLDLTQPTLAAWQEWSWTVQSGWPTVLPGTV